MKVLHIIGGVDLKGGGPSVSVISLNNYLNIKDIKSEIWTTNAGYSNNIDVLLKSPVYYKGSKVTLFPYPNHFIFRSFKRLFHSGIFAFSLYWNLFKNIKQFEIVHIHGFFSFYDLIASVLSRFYNIPYVLSLRGSLIKDLIALESTRLKNIYLNIFGKNILQNAKLVHCLTNYEQNEIEKFNFNLKQTAVLPNALDEDDLSQLPEKNKLFKIYPNLKGKKIALFLSRISFKKGLDDLIPAMKEVVLKEPDSHLLIVGNDDENYFNEAKSWIEQHGLEQYVTYVGPAFGQDKLMYYQDCDLFVLPSYSENFALVVIEAMYFKLPVIVTHNVGTSEYVEKSKAGIVINKNREKIAQAILNVFKNKESSIKMGENGHNFVKENLTWDKVVNKYIEAYQSMIDAEN